MLDLFYGKSFFLQKPAKTFLRNFLFQQQHRQTNVTLCERYLHENEIFTKPF